MRTFKVKVWSRGPGIISLTFSASRGIFPLAKSSFRMVEYDSEKVEKFVSSLRIREILKMFHEEGAEQFALCKRTLHARVDLTVARIKEIIRAACPNDIVYITDNMEKHRKFKVTMHQDERGLLIIFPRARAAGFCPLAIFPSPVTIDGPIGLDEHPLILSDAGKVFMKELFKHGAKVRLAETLVWVFSELQAKEIGDLLNSTYPQGWLYIQII